MADTDQIIIERIEPYDGSYELDILSLTGRELHKIKQMSGLRRNEIGDAFAAGDTDLIVALAAIAIERRGKYVDEDLLWDTFGLSESQGNITLVLADREGDAGPPALTNGDGSSSVSDERRLSSGLSGSSGSESSQQIPEVITTGSSPASPTSDPQTSVT